MNFAEYSKRLYKNLSGINSQGHYIGALFHAGGSSYFPLKPIYDTDSYQRKVFRGVSSFNQDMKDSFHRPINKADLMIFFHTRIGETALPLIMRSFGIPETKPINKEYFIKALCTQFQNIVSDVSDEVDDIVATEYFRLLRESGTEIKIDKPYYPGDDFQLVDQYPRYNPEFGFYKYFEHKWTIKNSGTVTWEGRYLLLKNQSDITIRAISTEIKIPKVKPGEDTCLTIEFESRGCEGDFEAIWEMKDAEGRSCFTEQQELKLAGIVVW